jgi:hypothetical protein
MAVGRGGRGVNCMERLEVRQRQPRTTNPTKRMITTALSTTRPKGRRHHRVGKVAGTCGGGAATLGMPVR